MNDKTTARLLMLNAENLKSIIDIIKKSSCNYENKNERKEKLWNLHLTEKAI